MLRDQRRTKSFLEAVRNVVSPGDVVIDIGTGTGILAAAAAQAGARHVYAVEIGGRVARVAERLFEANGLTDRITIVRGFSTNVTLPERGDVLVSELIGDEPFSEGILRVTRDSLWRLLKPGARLLPSAVRLLGVPVTIPESELEKLVFAPQELGRWEDLYRLDFSALAALPEPPLLRHFVNSYETRNWPALTQVAVLANINLRSWRLPRIVTRNIVTASAGGVINGFVLYFELETGRKVFFTTRPDNVAKENHWHSPVQVLARPLRVRAGDQLEVVYWNNLRSSLSGCRLRVIH
jgi:SAM-dependent methyltransferase